jgi:hypothetical protein
MLSACLFCALSSPHVFAQSLQREVHTRTGKRLAITETHPTGRSLSDVRLVSQGFVYEFDGLFQDVDPISEVVLTDLDEDGFDELYLVCISVGSGSYGSILAFSSNRDLSISMINFPEIEEGDERFIGYRGHDRFTFSGHRLTRTFPLYREPDKNNMPTGGAVAIVYELVPGEAMRQLVIVDFHRTN